MMLTSTNRNNVLLKALIDLLGIQTNQDFCISRVDVKNEKDNSVLAGVSFPPPYVPFAIPTCYESPSPFLSNTCHAGL